MEKKYPIGTKIRYISSASFKDTGKVGTIVGYEHGSTVRIIVPNSDIGLQMFGNSSHPWTTDISSLEILLVPNQQLLFNFMYEE